MDDIIRMAREAGWSFMEAGMDAQRLARFAALVRADEREACAKAARTAMLGAEWALTERVLRAIRARGQQPAPCPDCRGLGYDASGQICACQDKPTPPCAYPNCVGGQAGTICKPSCQGGTR